MAEEDKQPRAPAPERRRGDLLAGHPCGFSQVDRMRLRLLRINAREARRAAERRRPKLVYVAP